MTSAKDLRHNMCDSERSMIRFLLRWAPFDSGDEEIFPTFGISPGTFYQRVGRLLETGSVPITHHDRTELATYCARKANSTRPR